MGLRHQTSVSLALLMEAGLFQVTCRGAILCYGAQWQDQINCCSSSTCDFFSTHCQAYWAGAIDFNVYTTTNAYKVSGMQIVRGQEILCNRQKKKSKQQFVAMFL